MSKGCKPRPMLVSRAEFEKNWDRALGKYKPLKVRGVFKKCGQYSLVIGPGKPRFIFHK